MDRTFIVKQNNNRSKQIILGLFVALSALGFQLLVLFGAFQKLGLSGGGESALRTKIVTVMESSSAFTDVILLVVIVLLLHLLAGLLMLIVYRLATWSPKWRESWLFFGLFALLCWFCLAGWATIIFPYSRQSSTLDLLFTYNNQYRLVLFAASLLVIIMTGFAVLRLGCKTLLAGRQKIPHLLVASLAVLLSGMVGVFSWFGPTNSDRPSTADRPDVYIIGIDSLNLEILRTTSIEELPALKGFLQNTVVFERVSTPLARTFPAWMSVLSGNYPVTSGVRINLQPREQIPTNQLISRRLQSIGYKTYYSTDETRFANIDQSFGFDGLLASRQGALDFLIGTFNDLWISNFLVNSTVFGHLFPYNFLNRAAYHHYLPSTYSTYLRGRMKRAYQLARKDQDPLFFAIHLCTPHWPYTITPSPEFSNIISTLQPDTDKYRQTLKVIDEQLASIFESIRQSGRYDQSWIFLISDHGEELPGYSSLSLTADSKQVVKFGHGTDVLSDEQYGVLLAIKSPENNSLRYDPDTRVSASLVDIAPTIAEIAGLEVNMDGVSLLSTTISSRTRVILRESGYTPTSVGKSGVTEAALINNVADFYKTSSDGRFEFKSELLPEIFRTKSRAIEYENEILGLEYQYDSKSWLWRIKQENIVSSFAPSSQEASLHQGMIDRFCAHWSRDLQSENLCGDSIINSAQNNQ